MAITHNEVQVTWPTAADSLTIAAASNGTSEAVAFNATTIAATLTLKADNNGTPATGDTADFYILYCNGDPDGAGSDEYDTVEHATFLCRLNTYTTDTPGEDPAILTVPIECAAKIGFKIYCVNNIAATRSMIVSATMCEVRG